jgi:hypothetical protein
MTQALASAAITPRAGMTCVRCSSVCATGTTLGVDDEVNFNGIGRLAAPIASRDVKKRWETSLEKLKVAA